MHIHNQYNSNVNVYPIKRFYLFTAVRLACIHIMKIIFAHFMKLKLYAALKAAWPHSMKITLHPAVKAARTHSLNGNRYPVMSKSAPSGSAKGWFMAALGLFLFISASNSAHYYISNQGSDGNKGTSKDSPWKTVSRVNRHGEDPGFKPGDRICFKGGALFDDAVLKIMNSGEKGMPIVFTSYGEGKAHLTLPGTSHDEIIQILDQKHFIIENLEISSPGFDMSKTARGIRIELTRDGAYPGIVIRNNYIHDINGGMWTNRHLRGGIWMRSRNDVHGYTTGMLVENNRIERCHTRGIKLDAQGTAMHQNMVVRNNYVDNTGQAGIVIGHVKGGRIEGNTVYRAGNYYPPGDQAGVLAACWAAHSQNIIIQYNEVAYTKMGDVTRPDGNLNEMSHDSEAFDIDVTAPGWHLIQYNYTHDNEGGFFLWMGKPGPDFEWAVIRYNLSVNDGKGFDNRLFELHSHEDSNHYPVYVYNNTFVNDERIWVNNRNPEDDNHRGWVFENNIFYAPRLQFDDQTTIQYRNNVYWPGNAPGNDDRPLHANPLLTHPREYFDGWEAIENFTVGPESPAIASAVREASRSLTDVGEQDLYGHVLPADNRSIGAHEPRERRRFPLQPTLESRSKLIIEEMARKGVELQENYGGGKNGAYPAMVQFETGNIELGRQFVREQLTGSGAMFREFGTMTCYMKYGHLYGAELREEVRQNQLHHSTVYKESEDDKLPGATENHKLMYAAANYMGGLAWPDEYPEKWYRTGYDYLMNWYEKVTAMGYWEEDSPIYFIHHVSPILSVWEHAPEGSDMKRKSKMVLDWYFASVAPEYLKGYWIAGHARDNTPVHGTDLSEESSLVLWLYFANPGQRAPHPHPPMENTPYRQWLVTAHFATSGYQPPEMIMDIARDRDEAFVHRELMKRNPMEPHDYSFLNKTYGMASVLSETGRIPEDMTRWKLQWVAPEVGREPSLFILKHPHLYKKIKGKWQDWRGASPYEAVLQHEGVLLTVYGIPEDDDFPFIDGPFHDGAYDRVMQQEGWWFFENESVLFGVYAENGLEITGEKRMAYHHFGSAAQVDVLRSEGRRNALVIQTALPEEFPADENGSRLDAFARDVLAHTQVGFQAGKGKFPTLYYKSLAGDELALSSPLKKTINGEKLKTGDWPMLGNPWMHQEVGERKLTIEYMGEKRVYDFQQWEMYHE